MRKFEKKVSKKLQKSVSHVICRIKSQTSNLHISSTTNRILNGCRRPKSIPFYANSHRLRRRKSNLSDQSESEMAASELAAGGVQIHKTAATLEDIDQFMYENFRSLCRDKYDSDREDVDEELETPAATYDSSHRSFETPDLTPGDSRRFFISPSSVPSAIEEARSSHAQSDDAGYICSTITSQSAAKSAILKTDPASEVGAKAKAKAKQSLPSEDCIVVLKASVDPREDFQRSMGNVMEARAKHGEMVDWGFMEELLFSYLRLNEKKHYRFVLDAFVDSVVDMRRNSCDGGGIDGGVTEEEVAQKETPKKKGKERKEDI